jgi:hypothetical protein
MTAFHLNRDEKRKLFVRIITSMSAREQFWLVRIILKGTLLVSHQHILVDR